MPRFCASAWRRVRDPRTNSKPSTRSWRARTPPPADMSTLVRFGRPLELQRQPRSTSPRSSPPHRRRLRPAGRGRRRLPRRLRRARPLRGAQEHPRERAQAGGQRRPAAGRAAPGRGRAGRGGGAAAAAVPTPSPSSNGAASGRPSTATFSTVSTGARACASRSPPKLYTRTAARSNRLRTHCASGCRSGTTKDERGTMN